MNLNLLPILQSLLSTKNVTRSAEQLHMSQSAVSEALGKLRIQFNDELLVKVGREMRPTPLALSLQDQLDETMGSLETLIQKESFVPADLERRFVISTADTIMLALADSLINRLKEEAPGVSIQFVDIKVEDQSQLEAGELDFMVAPKGILDVPELFELPLYEDTFVGIARKGHPAIRKGLTRATYDGLDHVAFRTDHRSDITVETTLVGPNQKDLIRLPSFVLLPALVERSDSIALIQKRAAEHFLGRYDIQMFEPPFKVPVIYPTAHWGRIHDRDPAHQWFRTLLKSTAESA